MALRIENLSQTRFMIEADMRITGQSFRISQREYARELCAGSNQHIRHSISWVFTLLCTTYSISDVTWFQRSIIETFEKLRLQIGTKQSSELC